MKIILNIKIKIEENHLGQDIIVQPLKIKQLRVIGHVTTYGG